MTRQKILPILLACFFLGFSPPLGWGSPEELKEVWKLNEQVEQLSRVGRFSQALPPAQKALQICYKILGPEHPETAISLTTLGLLYQETGAPNDALPLLERALQIRYKALGPSNSDTAASLSNLAELYRTMAAYDKALPLFERALRIRERVQGPEHPDTAASLNNLAALYQDKGEYDKALPLYERALKIREKALTTNHPDTAISMNNLAELYRIMGTYDKSLMLHERAFRIYEKTLGPFHPGTALSLNNLATLYDDMGFYIKAQPLYERALQIRQKALGLEHLGTAQSLNNLGVSYHHLKEYDKALPLHERALLIREKAAGPEHPETAASLNNLASLHKDMGASDQALGFYERALKIREQALGPDHPDTVNTLNNLAALHQDMGALAKAVPLYERVIRIKEKNPGPDHPETAVSLTNLARVYQSLGEYDKAQPLYNRSVKIREKALGAEHPETIISLNTLAAFYSDMGAYEKSVSLYERVLKIRDKTPGPDHPDTAISLNNLALAYQGLGEYDKALPLYNRSLKIKETAPDPEQPGVARTLVNLASLYQALGAYDKAQPLYERALKIREKVIGTDHPEVASNLANLAGLFVTQGMYEKALPLYERTWKIYEKAKGASSLETAASLQKLATLYQVMGDYDKALPLYDRAARVYEKTLGAEHPDTGRILLSLGLGYLAKNDSEKAEEVFKRLKAKESLIDLALSRGRPEEAWQLVDEMTPAMASTPTFQTRLLTQKGQALAGVGRLPDAAVNLWQAVQGSEKKPFRSLISRIGFTQDEKNLRPHRALTEVLAKLSQQGAPLPPELQEFGPTSQAAAFSLAEATKARSVLEALAKAPQPSRRLELPLELRHREETLQIHLAAHEAQWDKAVAGGQEALKEVIQNRKKLTAAHESLISDLRQTQPLYAALYYPQPVPVKDLPLADNEVIIAYALGDEAGSIFVVRRDGVQYLYPLPVGRKALEAQVQEFMEPLINARAGGFSLKKGQDLYNLLLAKPLATVSPGEQVIIVPDGILGALPFEALVMVDGLDPDTSIFVGDQRILRYYPSATVLAQQRGRAVKPTTRPLLALGNPTYLGEELPPTDKKKKAEQAAPPPGTDQRVTPPGYPALATNLAWGPTTRGKTGSQGLIYPPLPETEAAIQELGRIFEIKPEPPDILLGPEANETLLRQAPLPEYRYLHFAAHTDLTDKIQGRLEPFIVLGQVGNKSPDNGVLTLNEVLELDLGAQMVVLPQGRAGRGQALEGDGVINLARAFQYAGAQSVLTSLWKVNPEIAQEFLRKFYGFLKDGHSRTEALRLARFDLRMQHPDPVFWAGFILYGEG